MATWALAPDSPHFWHKKSPKGVAFLLKQFESDVIIFLGNPGPTFWWLKRLPDGPNPRQYRKVATILAGFYLSIFLRVAIVAWHTPNFKNRGEINFVWAGFLLQITSQMAECSKNLIGEVVMSGAGAAAAGKDFSTALDSLDRNLELSERILNSILNHFLQDANLEFYTLILQTWELIVTQQAVLKNRKAWK